MRAAVAAAGVAAVIVAREDALTQRRAARSAGPGERRAAAERFLRPAGRPRTGRTDRPADGVRARQQATPRQLERRAEKHGMDSECAATWMMRC